MKKPIIEFQNVSFRYDSEEEGVQLPLVAENLNLQIHEGEFVAILGHNGSGKSTLAKLTNAILLPNEEDLKIKIRQTVGMVFQNPDNQIVETIVEEDVAFGPENLGVEPKEIRRRVDESLKAVGMYEFRKREPHRLSGGQKQRVAIAGIIAMLPRCIVLDEPTAMLDPRGRQEVMSTMLKLNREMGMTVVFITHFMDEAVQADRVVVMDDAKIIMDGKPKEVFMQVDRLEEIGLDVPQPTKLAQLLKQEGYNLPDDILDVDECIEKLSAFLEE